MRGGNNTQRATAGLLKSKLRKSGEANSLAKKMDQLMSRIPRGTFASVGGALGGPAGALVGRGVSAITGYGDYTVKANSLSNSTMIGEMADQVPVFKQQGADIRVRHCEFVADLVVPADKSAFNSITFDIDPTSTDTFPWLASVASKYQKFKVKGMVIGYRSTSTDYNNSGVVAIAVNYDPAETAYASMTDLLNSKFAVSTKPSNSMLAPVECDPSRSPIDGYYVKHQTSTDVTDASIRQTVMGKINIATSGLTLDPGATIGQVYVSYDIEFLYPYMHVASGPVPPSPVTTRSGSISAALPIASQNAMNSKVVQYGYGNIAGWTATPVAEDVLLKWVGNPAQVSSWLQVVMPVGRYNVTTLDGGMYEDLDTYFLQGTTRAATFGSAIAATINLENTSHVVSEGRYTLVVGPGTEVERTWTPCVQYSRAVGTGSASAKTAFALSYVTF